MVIENEYCNKYTLQDCYNKSMIALTKYIENNEKNPNEIIWNKYAVENRYLSSKTLGYLGQIGFNKLCKEIRKSLK